MNHQNQYVLVAIVENFLRGHWSFRAADELGVARYLLCHAWDYPDVFCVLRISLQQVDHVAPDELLRAIHESYYTQRGLAALYLLRVTEPADCSDSQSRQISTGLS